MMTPGTPSSMLQERCKTCFKCNQLLPLSSFYKHPGMADGHLNKCKDCNKNDVRLNRKDKQEYYNEFDRNRSRKSDSERYRKKLEYGRNLPDTVKERRKAVIAVSKKKSPNRIKANQCLNNAIRDKKIVRPLHCSHCGIECIPQGHHSSYAEDMWLLVTWLCSGCHGEVHRKYE